MTKEERYLAYLNGEAITFPDNPETKVEKYLYALCVQGQKGGIIVDKVMDENSDNALANSVITKEFKSVKEKSELELAELKMLGWNVPKECPIQNELNGNQFTQNVDRIRFDDLEVIGTFGDDNHNFRFSTPTGIKKEWVKAVYIDGYQSVTPKDYAGWITEDDKTIGLLSTYEILCMKDNSCSTSEEFVSKLTGKYVYYLLATPVTKTDGNEAVSEINEHLAKSEDDINTLKSNLYNSRIGIFLCIEIPNSEMPAYTPENLDIYLQSLNLTPPTKLFLHCSNVDEMTIVGTWTQRNVWTFLVFSYASLEPQFWTKRGHNSFVIKQIKTESM